MLRLSSGLLVVRCWPVVLRLMLWLCVNAPRETGAAEQFTGKVVGICSDLQTSTV